MTRSQFISILLSVAAIVAIFSLGENPATYALIGSAVVFFIAMTVAMARQAKAARLQPVRVSSQR